METSHLVHFRIIIAKVKVLLHKILLLAVVKINTSTRVS